MKSKDQITPQEQDALTRYLVVSYIKELQDQDNSLAESIRRASQRPWPDADTGKTYAPRTLEDWWYAYNKGGFQNLIKAPRNDCGHCRALNPDQKQWLIEQRQTYPRIPVKVGYQMWLKTPQGKDLPSLTTVARSSASGSETVFGEWC